MPPDHRTKRASSASQRKPPPNPESDDQDYEDIVDLEDLLVEEPIGPSTATPPPIPPEARRFARPPPPNDGERRDPSADPPTTERDRRTPVRITTALFVLLLTWSAYSVGTIRSASDSPRSAESSSPAPKPIGEREPEPVAERDPEPAAERRPEREPESVAERQPEPSPPKNPDRESVVALSPPPEVRRAVPEKASLPTETPRSSAEIASSQTPSVDEPPQPTEEQAPDDPPTTADLQREGAEPRAAEQIDESALPAGGELPALPARAELRRALGRMTSELRRCTSHRGVAMMQLTLAGTGRILDARPSGPWGSRADRSCISGVARAAHVPRFSQEKLTVQFPFVL